LVRVKIFCNFAAAKSRNPLTKLKAMKEKKKKKQNYNFHFSMEDKEAELWWEWVGSRYGGDPDYSKWNYNANMDKDLIEVLKLNK